MWSPRSTYVLQSFVCRKGTVLLKESTLVAEIFNVWQRSSQKGFRTISKARVLRRFKNVYPVQTCLTVSWFTLFTELIPAKAIPRLYFKRPLQYICTFHIALFAFNVSSAVASPPTLVFNRFCKPSLFPASPASKFNFNCIFLFL